MSTGKKFINLLFAPLIIAIAIGAVIALVNMRKPPPPRDVTEAVPQVEILQSSPTDAVPSISTFGTVRAYQESSVTGQVAGRIESIDPNFDPGRAVKAGELLAKIEEADYITALAERQSALRAAAQMLAEQALREPELVGQGGELAVLVERLHQAAADAHEKVLQRREQEEGPEQGPVVAEPSRGHGDELAQRPERHAEE